MAELEPRRGAAGTLPRLIAHRAGNRRDTVDAASKVADAIEFDVHRRRGRLEVRHAKVVWPTRVQWDRWWIDHRPPEPPSLAELVAHTPGDVELWLDLKGFRTVLCAAALREVPEHHSITLSSRSWWILRPARAAGVRTMRSVGSRWQLWAIRAIRRWAPTDGVVINDRFLEPGVLEELGARTLAVWGVDDRTRARELLAGGVDGLILDDLALMRSLQPATLDDDAPPG